MIIIKEIMREEMDIESDIIDLIYIPLRWHHYWHFLLMLILTGGFFVVELVFGLYFESLVLLADAIHMLSDLIALLIAMYVMRVMNRKANNEATYGWQRAEIVGALVNGIFLLSSCLFITMDAIQRFFEVRKFDDFAQNSLIIVGGMGLGINIIGFLIFYYNGDSHSSHSHTHSRSLNMQALLLHILGDMLGSIGVVISGLIIRYVKSEYKYLADPIAGLFIVVIILYSAIPLVKKCCYILLQNVPNEIDISEIKKEIENLEGIISCHHFHIWQLNNEKIIATLHIVFSEINNEIMQKVEDILHRNNIHSTTIQSEFGDGKCQNMICINKKCVELNCCQLTREERLNEYDK